MQGGESPPFFIDNAHPLTQNTSMNSRLILEGIAISGYCGLTQDERGHLQPIRIDLEIDCANSQAGKTDDIQHTIDYAQIINRLLEIGTHNQFYLIESLAEHITRTLFDEFPILGLKLWVRKTNPPLKATVDSVGVRLARDRSSHETRSIASAFQSPSTFLTEQKHQLPKGKILDVATGHGRNALYLANLGYSVTALDRDEEALRAIQQEMQNSRFSNISIHAQDLEDGSPNSLNLGTELYEGIIVFSYLYRPLFPSLLKALRRKGVLIYETFLIDNHRINDHPRRKEFCLQHNELFQLTQGLRIVHYEEGARQGPNLQDQIFTARMVARKE
jgi:dihydroneopterin aldolase